MSIQVEEKKYPKMLVALVVSVILVFALVITAFFAFGDVMNVKKGGVFIIEEGFTVNRAAAEMKEDDIIKFPLVFRLISRVSRTDTKIKPGRIEITEGMSYFEILDMLSHPDTNLTKVLIPEGLELKEIAAKLSDFVTEDEFYEALEKDYNYRFLADIPEREHKLEGYLFPATYEISNSMTAEDIVDMMLKAFDECFKGEYYTRAQQLGMTVDEIVTLASIIERESNSGEDRAKVAGVFYNRLNKNMRLQSCATVQYILKERKAVLSNADTKIESPYNTYLNSGLPLGPIASPGEECIKAALYPEETDALYFVLGADGKHIFSATYDEHLSAKHGGQ
ncbi:MAG: endolytic transglycosylase MltG [Clostridia bacterium]|nr:endolytic transglycosylase MltG [Clostridia bacterium]